MSLFLWTSRTKRVSTNTHMKNTTKSSKTMSNKPVSFSWNCTVIKCNHLTHARWDWGVTECDLIFMSNGSDSDNRPKHVLWASAASERCHERGFVLRRNKETSRVSHNRRKARKWSMAWAYGVCIGWKAWKTIMLWIQTCNNYNDN